MADEKFNLPKEFVLNMERMLGEDASKYFDAMDKPQVRGLRVNTKKISVEEFFKTLKLNLKPLSFENVGFILNSDEKLGASVPHLSGLFYLQEPSSMMPVAASQLESEPHGLKILDLCAAPGGKTGQIAVKMPEGSIVVSNEISAARAGVLFQNIERQGFKDVIITNEPPERLVEFEGYFDYVFVDAPCSGEGMFRKDPDTILEWSEKNQQLCATRQKEILSVAEKLVKIGGKLIYSTCTFSACEDEEIVSWLLKNFNFEPMQVPQTVKDVTIQAGEYDFARKFLPYTGEGEGQFVAVFKKIKGVEPKFGHQRLKTIQTVGKADYRIFTEFTRQNLVKSFPQNEIILAKGGLFLKPAGADDLLMSVVDKLKFLSLGVPLGTITNGRFVPSHSLFMAFGKLFKVKIELDDEKLKHYLHGEEILCEVSGKGFAAVTNCGMVVGGGRLSGGRLKNLYPKGLRI